MRFHCTYFHLNFVWKVSDGETESNVLVTFVVWQCLNCWWARKGGVSRKSYSGLAEIALFFRWGFSQSNKHDTF